MLTAYVNVDTPMSQQMMDALTVHESRCVFTQKKHVSETDVRQFLVDEFSQSLADEFSADFLVSAPEVLADPR